VGELFGYLHVVVCPSTEAVRIRVSGELDISTVGVLREALSAEAAAGGSAVVEVDMAATEFCDSVGLCALATARAELQESGRTLTIVNASRPVRRVLDLSGMGPLFDAVDASPSGHHVEGNDGVVDGACV
jgi:anti-anti-sigma factor